MTSAIIDRLGRAFTGTPHRGNARVSASTNVVLRGLLTIDGVTVESNDRVLCFGQTTASQNGVWLARTGEWVRAADLSTSADWAGPVYVSVEEGTSRADKSYISLPSGTVTVGTTTISFTEVVHPTEAFISAIALEAVEDVIEDVEEALAGALADSEAAAVAAAASAAEAAEDAADAAASLAAGAADLAATEAARDAAIIASAAATAALSGAGLERLCCYADPTHRNVLQYDAGTESNGDVTISRIIYGDGTIDDMTAEARGIPMDWMNARYCCYQDPDHRNIGSYEVGSDDKIRKITYSDDQSEEVIGGARNPIADPDGEAIAYVTAGDVIVSGINGTHTLLDGNGLHAEGVPTKPGKARIVSSRAFIGSSSMHLADIASFDTVAAGTAPTARFPVRPGFRDTLHLFLAIGQSLAIGSGSPSLLEAPFSTTTWPNIYMLANSGVTYQDPFAPFTQYTFADIRCGKYRGSSVTASRIREADLIGLIPYQAKRGPGSQHGITPIESLAVHWTEECLTAFGEAPEILLSSIGVGGVGFAHWHNSPVGNITPGTDYLDDGESWTLVSEFDNVVNAAMTLATARGQKLVVTCIVYKGGEQDAENTLASSHLETVINERNFAITDPTGGCYTGQAGAPLWLGSPPMFVHSTYPGGAGTGGAFGSNIGSYGCRAFIDAEEAGLLLNVCPDYCMMVHADAYDSDLIHMNEGYILWGDYAWQMIGPALMGMSARHGLRIDTSTVLRSGTSIVMDVIGGNGSDLAVDVALIVARPDTVRGFRYIVSGSPATISSVTVSGRTITVTLATGQAGTLECGLFGFFNSDGSEPFVDPDEAPTTNIRESVAFQSGWDDRDLYHWLQPLTIAVA